jgi:ornithine--oxo-acid transaminase
VSAPFAQSVALYREFVNPLWVQLLSEIGLLRDFVAGEGAYLIDAEGLRFLDLVGSFGAATLGHSHPRLMAALAEAAEDAAPGLLPWGISSEAALLASRLSRLAGAKLSKVYFATSGGEAVDSALKFAAAATKRDAFLCFQGGFHGLTVATTGLSGGLWSDPFPEIWPSINRVPTDDWPAIEAALADRTVAAIVLEIVQNTGGSQPWDGEALRRLAALAKSAGTLIIADEVVSGLGRTGQWFAFSSGNPSFVPDMVVVSKSLTGGLIPVSAVLMKEEVFQKVFGDRERAKIHGSTFSGARVGMTCGLAVLSILEEEDLLSNVRTRSAQLFDGFSKFVDRGLLAGFIGRGLLIALDISHGSSEVRASAASHSCLALMERGILTQIAGHDPGLLRLTPPFIIGDDEISFFLGALEEVLTEMQSQ